MQLESRTTLYLLLFGLVFLVITLVNIQSDIISQFKQYLQVPNTINNQNRGLNCEHNQQKFHVGQHGEYIVLYNYVKASKSFGTHESVTFTAPADYTFLDNLPTLMQRWQGPVSIALYAPGDDFEVTLKSIAYLRHCAPNSIDNIRDLVTFHVFFHQQHVPYQVIHQMDLFTCSN